MPTIRSKRLLGTALLFSLALGVSSIPLSAQTRSTTNSNNSYYRQAYDQGFRAGQADYNARRPFSYNTALVTSAGVQAISRDYRNAFKSGYQDGYAAHNRGSDYYYRRHQHDSDCNEDDSQGKDKWNCREHHDNGKHKGWYKHHHPKDDHDKDDDHDKGDDN